MITTSLNTANGVTLWLVSSCLVDPVAVRKAYATIKDAVLGKTASDTPFFLPELYVLCAEQALRVSTSQPALILEDATRTT